MTEKYLNKIPTATFYLVCLENFATPKFCTRYYIFFSLGLLPCFQHGLIAYLQGHGPQIQMCFSPQRYSLP